MRLGVTFLFFYFCPTQKIVFGSESRVIAEIVKQHQENDGWTKCLIVTMGLSPMLYKALGSILWLIYSQYAPESMAICSRLSRCSTARGSSAGFF